MLEFKPGFLFRIWSGDARHALDLSNDFMSSPTPLSTAPEVQLARGKAAEKLLSDPSFQEEWGQLATACQWATGFQTWEFADAWYGAYDGLYEPLLLFRRDSLGRLNGLLALAVQAKSKALVHVGAHQAEYQVWIASEEAADDFIKQALNLLAEHYPRQGLRLSYIPAGVPLGWRSHGGRWRNYSILQERSRPFLKLGNECSVEDSLKKRGNRNRINRLKRNGDLSFVHLRTRAELEQVIETVADFYDFRQGAISSSTPFRDDVRKREFTLRLLEKSNLTHASALMLNDVPIAANIGPVSPGYVSLGVFGYSPFYSESSPGRMHILLLGQHLKNANVQQLDLTPGGDSYKSEMADFTDQVFVLSVHFHPLSHAWQMSKAVLANLAKRSLPHKGRSKGLKARSFFTGPMLSLKGFAGWAVLLRRGTGGLRDYEVDISAAGRFAAEDTCKINSVSDLLLYQPSSRRDLSRRAFLSYAWQRLEAGDRVYTCSRDGTLLHCAWLRLPAKSNTSRSPGSDEIPPNGCLLWDTYTYPAIDKQDLLRKSLSQRIRDAAAMPGVERILVRAEAADPSVMQHVARLIRIDRAPPAHDGLTPSSGH